MLGMGYPIEVTAKSNNKTVITSAYKDVNTMVTRGMCSTNKEIFVMG